MAEEKWETRVICPVCMHHCRLAQGQYGYCRARKNIKGKITSINYEKITGLMLDPIEKKPLDASVQAAGSCLWEVLAATWPVLSARTMKFHDWGTGGGI